jgi:hypothetical protein
MSMLNVVDACKPHFGEQINQNLPLQTEQTENNCTSGDFFEPLPHSKKATVSCNKSRVVIFPE